MNIRPTASQALILLSFKKIIETEIVNSKKYGLWLYQILRAQLSEVLLSKVFRL
jgi:hypothetical protein